MVRRTTTLVLLVVTLLAGAVAPAAALPDWRTTQVSWDNPRDVRVTPRVVDMRWAAHDGFDRVVVVVRGPRPDYLTLFTDELTYDGSGKPVPLRGRYKTYLVLRPAATYTPAGEDVYDGRRLVRPGLTSLRGIALTGSFEGDVSFGFTTRTRAYRVFTLTRPSRVVIDFRH